LSETATGKEKEVPFSRSVPRGNARWRQLCQSSTFVAGASSYLLCSAAMGIVRPDHVVVVIEEDRAANAIGAANMPYFNALANNGLLYANSHEIGRPGQLDYLTLYSGSTQGVTDNYPGYSFANTNNLAKSLNSVSGMSFVGY